MKEFLLVLLWMFIALLAMFAIYVIVMTISAYAVAPIEYTRDSSYYRFLLNLSLAMLFFVARINVETEGLENVPEGTRFLLVSNHRSKFDPMAAWVVFKKYNLGFISKEKNFHIPWFGRIIRKCCCLSIDRENPRNAIGTVDKAAELLKNDTVSVGVYPEGTRSFSGELLPFHNGMFKIAQKAGVPIVVTTIEGTENIRKNYIRRRTNVRLKVVDVISAEEVRESRGTAVLGARVRAAMKNSLEPTEVGDCDEIPYAI
ncbi:MAG: 1-acyl-sn-glycerol-3-phosphate acyltransferase [Lachnospiraceae bacterium]|nr:1-acyl-sn-glycerol-3-phosphate acyltransferase [Lachnospiraceae bacterium]